MATVKDDKKVIADIDDYVARRFGTPDKYTSSNPIDDYVARRFAGVKPEGQQEAPEYDGGVTGGLKRFLSGILGGGEFLAKGIGAEMKGSADETDKKVNYAINSVAKLLGYEGEPIQQSIVGDITDRIKGKAIDYIGDLFKAANESRFIQSGFDPDRKWNNERFTSIVSDPAKAFDYVTDTSGLLYDLPQGVGNAIDFMALARLAPKGQIAKAVAGATGRASGLFGDIGASRLAQAADSNLMKQFLQAGAEYGTTMAPAQVLMNGGMIVDELRSQGKSDSEIKDTLHSLYGEEAPVDLLFAILTGNIVKGTPARMLGRNASTPARVATNLGAGLPLETVGGYYSNVNQAILADKYSGKPYGTWSNPTKSEDEAGWHGAITAVPFSVIGAYTGARGAKAYDEAEAARKAPYKALSELLDGKNGLYGQFRQDVEQYQEDSARLATRYAQAEAERGGYYGEGGAGEGKTWVRGNGASLNGAQPQLLDAIDMLAKKFYEDTGVQLVVTAGTNGDHPSNGSEHGHDAGWKVDIADAGANGVDINGDGALFTSNYEAQPYLQKFVDYGRSLGLGMNVEGLGTSNVHIDVALDGTQWDGYGEHAGGFNPRKGGQPQAEQGNSVDPNFTDRQNEIWQMAQYASQRLRDKHGIRLAPELIYRQWTLEDGGDFTHPSRNWGGLKDTAGNFRTFASDKEYADAYVDDFMALRPEINNITDENGRASDKAFTDVMLDTGYITHGDYNNYIEGLANISSPSATYKGGGQSVQSRADELYAERMKHAPQWQEYLENQTRQQQEQESATTPESVKPRLVSFPPGDDSDETKSVYDSFAKDRMDKALIDEDVDSVMFLRDMFKGDEFQNTPENRAALAERYSDDFTQFVQSIPQQTVQPTQPAPAQNAQQQQPQQQPKAGSKLLRNDPVMQAGRQYLDELNNSTEKSDKAKALQLQTAISQGDAAGVESILKANNRPTVIQQQTMQTQQQQAPQQQQDPVQQNTTPENKLQEQQQQQQQPAQETPKKQPKTGEEKAVAALQKPVKAGASTKTKKQKGNAILKLADANGIEIPEADRKSLSSRNPKSKTINEWRDRLIAQGIIPLQDTTQGTKGQQRQQPPQPAPQETAPTLEERANNLVAKATQSARENWQDIQQNGTPTARAQRAATNLFNNNLQAGEQGVTQGNREMFSGEDELPNVGQRYNADVAKTQREQETQAARQQVQQALSDFQQSLPTQEQGVTQGNRNVSNVEDELPNVQQEFTQVQERTKNDEAFRSAQEQYNRQRVDNYANDDSGATQPRVEPRKTENAFSGEDELPNLQQKYTADVARTEQEQKAQNKAQETQEAIRQIQQALTDLQRSLSTQEEGAMQGARDVAAESYSEQDIFKGVEERAENARKEKQARRQRDLEYSDAESNLEQGAMRGTNGVESENYRPETLEDIKNREEQARQARLKNQQRNLDYSDMDSQPYEGVAPGMRDIANEEDAEYLRQLHDETERNAPAEEARRAQVDEQRRQQAAQRQREEQAQQRKADESRQRQERDEAQNKANFEAELPTLIKARNWLSDNGNDQAAYEMQRAIEDESLYRSHIIAERNGVPEEILPRVKPRTDANRKSNQKTEASKKTPEQMLQDLYALSDSGAFDQYSMQGEADTRIGNVVKDEDLTPQQKQLKDFAKKLGVTIQFFDNPDGNFHGAFSDGVTFLNVNSKKGLGDVFWHEVLHWLKANNPELYKQLVKAAGITDADRQAFLDRTKRTDLHTDEAIDEEILADQMSDVAKRTGLMQSIAGKNRGVVQRVMQWLKDTLNNFIETFRNPTGGLKTAQAKALAAEFGRLADQIKDANGNQMFRYNRRTGDVEVVGGRETPAMTREQIESAARSDNVKYSFAGEKAKTADRKKLAKAKRMDTAGETPVTIFRETGWIKGKDNKWRFEIPDDYNFMDFSMFEKRDDEEDFGGEVNASANLEDVYRNRALYKAYPDLRGVRVTALGNEWYGDDTGGYHRPAYTDKNGYFHPEVIALDVNRIAGYRNVTSRHDLHDILSSALVHEIQHAIQSREGFAEGSNEDEILNEMNSAGYDTRDIDASEAYLHTGGEEEAREVSSRALVNTLKSDVSRNRNLAMMRAKAVSPELQAKVQKIVSVKNGVPIDDDAIESIEDDYTYNALQDWAQSKEDLDRITARQSGYTETPKIHSRGSVLITRDETASPTSVKIAKSITFTDDNSNESWGKKAANWVRGVFGGKKPTKAHQQVIVDALSALAKHKIYFGYNGKQDADYVVDSFQKVIRARHGYDFATLLPVVGKQIAKNLKLADTDAMSNYIADWMMTGAVNNTSPEAREFAKAMRDNPGEAELLRSVRNSFDALSRMTPEERFDNSIVQAEKPKKKRGGFMEEWVDDLNPIKALEDKLVAKSEDPAIAKLIKEKLAPYLHARIGKGKGALTDMMVGTKGMSAQEIQDTRDVLGAQFTNVDFSDWVPLKAIVDHAGGDMKGLERYALAKLEKEMYEKMREVDKDGNPKYTGLVPSHSEADCDAVIKAGEKKFGKAQEELVHYANTLAAIQYTSGLITATQFYRMIGGWENYIPTARVFDEDEPFSVDLKAADSSKQKKGSYRRIVDPLQKLAANTEIFMRQAINNDAKLRVVAMARCGDFGEVFAEAPKGDQRGHTIHFREDGKIKYLVTSDESIVRALESIQTPADSNVVVQALKTMGLVMRGMYTMFNTEFMAGNPSRDMPDSYIHNKYGSWNPLVAVPMMVKTAVDGFAQSMGIRTQDKAFKEFLAHGGTQSGFSFEITGDSSSAVEDMAGNMPSWKKVWRKFIQAAEASENMTRYATYKTALEGITKEHGGRATEHDKDLAALQARSATVDFARAGRSMRSVNKYLLFSNAAMQSLSLWGEAIADVAKGKKGAWGNLGGKVFKTIMGSVVPAMLLSAFIYSDDDRRKRYGQLHSWEKDNYWVLPVDVAGYSFRIPKGMDIMLRFTSALTEELVSHLAEDKPVEWKRASTVLRNGLPSLTTTVFTPLIETWVNYSVFKDAPIVPYGEQDDPKYKQYGKTTTAFAKWFGKAINESPRQIDHLISGYLGSQFSYVASGFEGVPLVLRRFMFDPDKNPRVVQDYYEKLREQNELLNEYKARREDGEKVDLPEDYDRALHARLKAIQEPMRKISSMEKKITESDKLDDDQKKEKIRKLEERRVALCERVFKKAR